MKIPKSKRSRRLGNEFQKVVSDFFRAEVEPLYPGALITVPEIRVSDDFKHAGIYISIRSGEHSEQKIQRSLLRSLPSLRKTAAATVHIRQLPEFRLIWDDTLERADRIEQLLEQAKRGSTGEPEQETGDEPA